MVLEKIEPFGERRLDLLHADLCALVANIGTHSNKFKLADFLPDFEKKSQTPEDIFKAMTGFMNQHNKLSKPS